MARLRSFSRHQRDDIRHFVVGSGVRVPKPNGIRDHVDVARTADVRHTRSKASCSDGKVGKKGRLALPVGFNGFNWGAASPSFEARVNKTTVVQANQKKAGTHEGAFSTVKTHGGVEPEKGRDACAVVHTIMRFGTLYLRHQARSLTPPLDFARPAEHCERVLQAVSALRDSELR